MGYSVRDTRHMIPNWTNSFVPDFNINEDIVKKISTDLFLARVKNVYIQKIAFKRHNKRWVTSYAPSATTNEIELYIYIYILIWRFLVKYFSLVYFVVNVAK